MIKDKEFASADRAADRLAIKLVTDISAAITNLHENVSPDYLLHRVLRAIHLNNDYYIWLLEEGLDSTREFREAHARRMSHETNPNLN